MIKVNLISKKSRAYRGRNWTRIIVLSLFGLIGVYFVGVTLYVVISMMITSSKIKKVEVQSASISNVMLANNEKLSRFVLTKMILSKVQDINKEKFHYKDYLDQISLLLPSGSVLSAVDFSIKGWISASVNTDNLSSFDLLEKSLNNKDVWSSNKYFSGVYIENISRPKTGLYSTHLQFELKK